MPQPLTDSEFDQLADRQLKKLHKALMDFDPDEVETELSMGVLSLTVLNSHKVVINSHRAARQIWMAAQRKAWHFDPDQATGTFTTAAAELVATLEQVLGGLLKRPIALPAARG
jgi:CyaY protein